MMLAAATELIMQKIVILSVQIAWNLNCRLANPGCRIRNYLSFVVALFAFLGSFASFPTGAPLQEPQAIQPAEAKLGRPVDFERDVYPILDSKCMACHNVAINENGLNLEDVKNILKGGKRGPAVVAKDRVAF